ncbi:MAG TPA: class I SAM-dependent RNA methyltransferase [Gemmatimonadaceae bacterium]|nr:class I SAM-dependent RNA methyltransferase [Gemmatimonadaceae bacterium]
MTDSSSDLYLVTAPGLERITASELLALGITSGSVTHGGIAWRGSMRDLYRANLWLRTATRVLIRASKFHAGSFAELERRAKTVPWGRVVRARDRVRFRVTCHKSALYHSDAVAQRLGESVAAATGCTFAGDSESEDQEPTATVGEQLFIVRIDHDTVTVSADSSGNVLYKRGYRQATAKAPMRETLAAAMLLSSGWLHGEPLLDPLCGAGTIPIEAALIARNMAPGIDREFRFERWPGFDRTGWGALREAALAGATDSAPASIIASDRDAGAIEAAMSNAVRAGVGGDVQITQQPLSAASPSDGRTGWLITNPPYGVRVGTDVRNLYARIGSMMRTSFAGWNLGLLSASADLDRQLGLPLEQVFESKNGGIAIRFLTFRGAD